ncbi:MAG: hypothetical protein HKO79_05975 [Desulfobacterales bacterium]|nr:hypothetical protein [Deltaproteobacteria bacterium]NNL42023.1 hypothetical protein [Desulfobacterales bacterium]
MTGMISILLKFLILAGMLLGLPLLGIVLAGYPLDIYFEFPPNTRYISHAPFSWIAFVSYTLFIVAAVVPLIIRGFKGFCSGYKNSLKKYSFPWWGWVGIFCAIAVWIMAWTRFSWFTSFQPHTFFPLWFSFILVVNALCFRKSGYCMMINRPGYFVLLFPVSAMFWWFFEYLNRFVQNWHYLGVEFAPWEYFLYATLSFSTVLPAVLGVSDLIYSSSWLEAGFKNFLKIKQTNSKSVAISGLVVSGIGLLGIGVWPDYLFPLLWISPFIIFISIMTLLGEKHALSDISGGDWRVVISSALAALICGYFWEMWNYFSLAKWNYSVPLVHRFKIFEMPILGYAGYLPFGLECAVIGGLVSESCMKSNKKLSSKL